MGGAAMAIALHINARQLRILPAVEAHCLEMDDVKCALCGRAGRSGRKAVH